MKMTKCTLALLACAIIGAGCATAPAPHIAASDLPNCLESNYDAQSRLFTIVNAGAGTVNQRCVLVVGAPGDAASKSRLAPGSYTIRLANGGGGGAGGAPGGGGGGGAGAVESKAMVNLTEGVHELTIGAGGPGGSACASFPSVTFGGGPGWVGSPSSIVRVATGEVILGTPGADVYARPTRGANERSSGKQDGHGGSGPGQASGGDGGHGGTATAAAAKAEAGDGAKMPATRHSGAGGDAGMAPTDLRSYGGGGGGATKQGPGGDGGGDAPGGADLAPVRGSLGSGGGGGGHCDPGARGGHGYIALQRN